MRLTPASTSAIVPDMRKYALQVHIDPPLIAWLREQAARRGCSLGEIVRLAIRALRDADG